MIGKIYDIFLDDNKIGTTELEKADAPMGVVFGQIHFMNITSGYDFFKTYCLVNKIELTDHPEDRLIQTMNIPRLKVFDINGIEIFGQAGCNVNGMDSDIFEITILGVAFPFYEEEFPHHVRAYHEMFKDKR